MMEANLPATTSVTQTEVIDGPTSTNEAEEPVLRLRLHKPRTERKVAFKEGTVDNEHMNKKKSKCCCIYKKPSTFGESSSESEDECEHCVGHTEVRREKRLKKSDDETSSTAEVEATPSEAPPGNGDTAPPAEPNGEQPDASAQPGNK